MPLPKKQVLQEIVEAESQTAEAPAVFLQEIKEPTHEEVLNEEPKKTRGKRKSK